MKKNITFIIFFLLLSPLLLHAAMPSLPPLEVEVFPPELEKIDSKLASEAQVLMNRWLTHTAECLNNKIPLNNNGSQEYNKQFIALQARLPKKTIEWILDFINNKEDPDFVAHLSESMFGAITETDVANFAIIKYHLVARAVTKRLELATG